MKQQFILAIFFLFVVSQTLLGQGRIEMMSANGRMINSTSRSGATNYDITLLPGQQFTGHWYYSVNGTTTKSGNHLMTNSPTWLTSVSPSNFSSSSCSDIVPIGFSFDAPTTPGVYTYTVVEGNGNWKDMAITLTVTNTPVADTVTILGSVNQPSYDNFTWDWHPSSINCNNNYYPDTSLSFDYSLVPNVSWLTIQPSSGTIDTSQTIAVTKTFQSSVPGTFYTLQVVNEEWKSYPHFKYYEYVVRTATAYNSSPDATWNVTATQSYADNSISGYTNSYGSGTAQIVYANSNTTNQIVKPLIFVEPFEFPTDDFDLSELLSRLDTANLSSELNLDDYDLIFLEFDKNQDFIQRNAFVLQELINTVNAVSGVDSLTVVGLSMGGVIAKYALADMEQNNQQHRVRLMATIDSPHKGANVPLGLQYVIEEFKSFQIPFVQNMTLLDVLESPNVSITFNGSEALDFLNLSKTPAAQQLLIEQSQGIPSNFLNYTHYHNNNATTLYDTFQAQYQSLGYPQHCRNIALSKGAFCDATQNPSFNGNIIYFNKTIDLLNLVGISSIDVTDLLSEFGINIGGSVQLTDFDLITKFTIRQTPEGAIGNICDLEVKLRPRTNNFWANLLIDGAIIYGNYNATVYKIFNPIDFKVKAKNDLTLYNLSGGHVDIDLGISDFAFVPTFSALDVHVDSLYKNITPFDNHRKATNNTNGEHIILDSGEANWLLDEVKKAPNYLAHCQPNLPDLDFKYPNISGSNSIDTNATISVNSSLYNAGNASITGQASVVNYYLSKDDKKDSTDILLNSHAINFSGSFWFYLNRLPLFIPVQIPAQTISGDYFIILTVDEINAIPESNEYNNLEVISITVNGVDTIAAPESLPSDWFFEPRDSTHCIIIPNDAFVGINGTQPKEGDYIGAFYEKNGVKYNTGYVAWRPSGVVLMTYGNDTFPSFKNGFEQGEAFTFRIYRNTTNQVFEAKAHFKTLSQDASNTINRTNHFYNGGISAIDSIYTIDTLNVYLNANWNIISSNVMPSDLAVTDICSDIESNMVLIKNGNGDVYTSDPFFGVNSIGNWSMNEGYAIKMFQTDTLTFIGASIIPELSPIAIPQGWQILGYYRHSPADISLMFQPIEANIALAKDILGNTYIPEYNINTIGNMTAGTGYKVKATSSLTLTYPENNSSLRGMSPIPTQQNTPVHFVMSPLATDNATIVFPVEKIAHLLNIGDEVGVFNTQNKLCGSAIYNGQNFAVTVWAQDAANSPIGLASNEVFSFKIWKNQVQQEVKLYVNNYEKGNGFYQKDQLSVVNDMDADMVTNTSNLLNGVQKINCFPNPAHEQVTIQIEAIQPSNVAIQIIDIQGKVQLQLTQQAIIAGQNNISIDLSKLSSGVHFYQITDEYSVYSERLVILK
ncbi:MAG: T9SS type A sorting domain-containing protein [Saprospiraceae bacterium]